MSPSSLLVKVELVVLLLFTGCTKESNPTSFLESGWNVEIHIVGYDEFGRTAMLPGATDVTLSAVDRTRFAHVPQGTTSYIFTDLPYRRYIAMVSQDGYYPASPNFYIDGPAKIIDGVANLFPFPSTNVRIDSISCFVNMAVPQVHVQMYAAQTQPEGGYRYAIVFVGLRPDVSPKYGNYICTQSNVTQSVGTSLLQTEIYRALHQAGLQPGTTVYVTARIANRGTSSYRDPATGLWIYGNLENNTKVVVSFVVP